ncbi:MAG TPA: amino-acid N-acetyltransferase [Chitinispirillaceae bacterium]|nr:amino-acid N-acetyltransferase [Chitinispirillaceae bacterium]
MDKIKLKEQSEVIRQAFGYIDQFKNQTFIIKIDDIIISNPLFPILIKDLVLLHRMGIRIILVPGARTRIDEVLQTYNASCSTVNGIRISPPEAIPFIKMAAFDVSNRIMTMLAENEANAVIGNWVRARSIGVRNGINFQSSGTVEKLQIDILNNVLEDGLIPIFPNIGWSGKGKPYNLSSNELALTLSIELKAAKLFFVTSKGGLTQGEYKIPDGVFVSGENTISQLSLDQAQKFLDLNISETYDESLELVTLGLNACNHGVKRVHIVDGNNEGMILKEIFSNRGLGTMIYSNQHENIRAMTHSDIAEVLRIMQPAVEDKILIPRTALDLEEKLHDYIVYEVDGTVHACGALHQYGQQGEIAAIVVDEMYLNAGIGKKIVSYLMEKAVSLKLKQVFLLTTQTSDWFSQLGFVQGKITDLPKEKQKTYNYSRNSLIYFYRFPRTTATRYIK